MKYAARLVTALAVIAFVVVTFVTAIVKVTATGIFVLTLFAALAWTALTAIVAPIKGGVLFFYTSVLVLVVLLGIAITRITKATTRTLAVHGFGATGHIPLTTSHLITYEGRGYDRPQATTTRYYYKRRDIAGLTKGFRRWLSRTIPFFASFRQAQHV